MHGKVAAIRDQHMYYSVPTLPNIDWLGDHTPPMQSLIREDRYARESIALGRNTRVEVMVLMGMGEDEKWRRIADFIEGCGGGT